MVHLIGFDSLDSDSARACLAAYEPGDTCVFLDAGVLIAKDFPLEGPGYILPGPAMPVPTGHRLSTIDHNDLVELLAERGPSTSWY